MKKPKERPEPQSRFADTNLDHITVHDPDGNPILPAPKRAKRVVALTDVETMATEELARFRLTEDGRVTAEWHSDAYREQVEHHGIVDAKGGHHIEDGEAFFNALSVTYANSSRMWVEEIEEQEVSDAE